MPGVRTLLPLSAGMLLNPPVPPRPVGPAPPAPIVLILTALLLLLTPFCAHAGIRSKTDVVIMKNGDKITGEIKSLEKGQLTIKPDYTTSSFILDWEKVDHIESQQDFMVSDTRGIIFTGKIHKDPDTKELTIIGSETMLLPNIEVVEIEQLGANFWKRVRGNIDFGTSFSQSNNQKVLSVQGSVGYQSQKYIYSLTTNTQFTSQQATADTNDTSVKASLYKSTRHPTLYYGGIANFLSSTAQQISLRSTYGATLNKRLIFTNRTNLNAIGGIALTLEKDSEGAQSGARTKALDSAFAINYSTFRFDAATFDTSFWLYPSITSPGRVRFTLNQDVYYKFLGDFYLRLSFYDNYDNQPVVGAPNNNMGGSTTVGWSFH